MKNLKAFIIIGLITASVGAVLFALDAHLNYRNILWAVAISVTLFLLSNFSILLVTLLSLVVLYIL